MQLTDKDESLTLVNIYAPTNNEPTNQAALLTKVYGWLTTLEIQNIILGGDFNIQLDSIPPHSDSSIPRPTTTSDSYLYQLQILVDDYNLVDVWKKKNPNSKRGTFHRRAYSSRLDYFFAPEHLLPSVTGIGILPELLSDHCIVTMQINIPNIKRGPGYWKFDNRLLADDTFVQQMRNHISIITNEDLDNPMSVWEWIKYKIREFCIAFVVQRKREQKAMITGLEKRLQVLAEDHDLTGSLDTIAEAQYIKRELAEILQEKANKAIFKAKAHWTHLGEKPSSYFLGLEKRQSKARCVTALKDDSGNIISDSAEILTYQKKYFSEIYDEDPSQMQPIEELQLPSDESIQVTESHRNLINLPFTHRCFHDALKDLNHNKSPGSDGITPEFYFQFWDLLHIHFYESMMYSLGHGSLSQEQRSGIITLIPKKDQDQLKYYNYPDNY